MRFSKMHALENDFMVVDAVTQDICFSSDIIRRLSSRHCGVGFDQLLLVEPPYDPDVDFHYRIFNSNGNEVNQCGNGLRCFARFVRLKKLTNKSTIYISTKTRRMILFIVGDEICVDMGEPIFDPQQVPFFAKKIENFYLIPINNRDILCGVVSMGNPHCVLIVQDIKNAEVSILGPILENHYFFPERANISFMEIVNDKHIRLRVYERDVGETRACGSAACAAVSVGIQQGFLYNHVRVDLLGGSLIINWNGVGHSLYMHGSATHIYDGCIYL